jgi:hypothetical protein
MGNHVVEIETASVDLDYSDIMENIEDTITQRVSDQICDEAWDAVEHQVDDTIRDYINNYELDMGVAAHNRELLREFNNTQDPCSLGKEFIRAVQRALTWDGTDFKERGPEHVSLTLDYDWVRATIAEQVRVQLRGVLHRMSTELSSNVD